MEDKTFELLTKMYSEFSSRFENVENEIKKVQIKLEHNIEPQIKVLFEDRDGIHKKLNSIEQKIDELSGRVEKQDVEIRVIKGGKPKASKG